MAAWQVWMSLAQSSHSHPSAAWVHLSCVLCPSSAPWHGLQARGPCFFLHKQKDEKLLKDTKATGGQELEVFPLFQELGL